MNKREIQNKISKIQETIQKLNDKLEQLKCDCLKEINRTGYERVCDGDGYYWIGSTGEICDDVDHNVPFDNQIWNNANYYNDENFAKMQARADVLWRKIRRWQALNDEPIDICNNIVEKYTICYTLADDHDKYDKLFSDYVKYIVCGYNVYFSSKEKCDECIEEFEDELNWYFTKYTSRMDMDD